MRLFFVNLFIIVFFSACSNKNQSFPMILINEPFTNPTLNQISKAEIGTNLFEKNGLFTYKAEIINPEGLNMRDDYEVVKKLLLGGLGYMLFKSNNENSFDLSIRKWNNFNVICNNELKCFIDKNSDNSFTYIADYPNGEFQKLQMPIYYNKIPYFNSKSFKQVALYQGKEGNTIKISFREFNNDLARPSFTQDINYELEKDGTAIIGFKGLRIKILTVTNVDVTYKVLKDYD